MIHSTVIISVKFTTFLLLIVLLNTTILLFQMFVNYLYSYSKAV